MLVGFKLASLFTLGVALSGAVALSSKKGCTFLKDQENLTKTVEYEYPLFSCSHNKQEKYRFYLVLKSTPQSSGKPEHKVFLEGYDVKKGEKMNFQEKIEGTPNYQWQLQVFSDKIKISTLTGAEGNLYGSEDAYCNLGELQVTEKDSSWDRTGILWEKAIKNIEFELKGCEKGIVGESCEIQIKEGVKLKWGVPLKPKEIFCSSRI
ncbi:hypothetical protein WEN_01635 [Mycoplasma wenyonii str. Massachusetts]|uniref:Lipoprotein n=1 Tax=Mycoplasma wenyonii (strain Massachusetts) TaxID=1197325 RepID=I6ZIU2_MYCWM|nr:hypothetical protein [Mycoplasma wenyonii]AFN65120.1 hypothetical protein WEN_01635 [Mycoplasma wenyonii str. Massachusetts]